MSLFRFAAVALVSALFAGCVIIPLVPPGGDELNEVTLVPAERRLTTSRFLLLDVSGVLSSQPDRQLWGEKPSSVQAMREALELAREDEHIKALILRIDSPGGGVTASDIMYHELLQYREETDVPVIAMLMGTAASGGYYIASAADRIVAHPTTVTGSIGVIVVGMNIQGLEDLVGVQVEAHTSGEHKDILSPFREMTDEERGIVQSVIDDMFGQFVDVVSAGRADHGLTRDQILTLADGRIYTAQQALDSGLVDEITYLPELIDDLKDEHDLRDVEVITYRRGYGASQTIYSRAPSMPSVDLNLISPKSVLGDLTPGFHYLWVPGL